MNDTSREAARTLAPGPWKTHATAGRTLATLLGLTALAAPATAQSRPITIGQAEGNNSTITGPGIKLTVAEIFSFDSAPAWKLTSFTWLSTKRSGALPTGRGHLLVFDASKFSPAGKTYAQVNGETVGLVATSATYADGEYVFRDGVTLERGKSYYFLNSAAITTDRDPAAPHQYGFSTSQVFNNLERWNANETAWSPAASPGAPNFSATLVPVPPATTPAR